MLRPPDNATERKIKKLTVTDYRVARLCPLPDIELPPARLMLDDERQAPKYNTTYDRNTYILGEICGHATVIAILFKARTGNVNAARIAGPARQLSKHLGHSTGPHRRRHTL